MRILVMGVLAVLTAAAAFGVDAAAQDAETEARASLSRPMRRGIQFYDKGDDAQAMDKFMEVLTRGAVSERPLANEYINLITHRMNTGESLPMPSRSELPEPPRRPEPERAGRKSGPEVVVEGGDSKPSATAAVPAVELAMAAPAEATAVRRQAEPPARAASADKAMMGREIKAKMRRVMESSLRKIRALEGVEVLMGPDGRPSAVGVPSDSLFQSGVAFNKSAAPWLEALTALAYSLSGAQIVILPEGANLSEAKILDMRRTMGVSAHLYSAGIAPSRVKVNLLNNQVDIPRSLAGFKGLILIFLYNQPLRLAMDAAPGEETGPALSLGVFPDKINPAESEGAIIEFSVQDPPAGLTSWEFKLMKPVSGESLESSPLQDVTGSNPVYHQIYWNARQSYFGAALPPGRYEALLIAVDAKNHRRQVQRWIQVAGAEPAPVPAAFGVEALDKAGPPPASLAEGEKPSAALLKPEAPKPSRVKKAASRKRKKAKPKRRARKRTSKAPIKAAASEEAPEGAPGGP